MVSPQEPFFGSSAIRDFKRTKKEQTEINDSSAMRNTLPVDDDRAWLLGLRREKEIVEMEIAVG